jgi:hypothetical protein
VPLRRACASVCGFRRGAAPSRSPTGRRPERRFPSRRLHRRPACASSTSSSESGALRHAHRRLPITGLAPPVPSLHGGGSDSLRPEAGARPSLSGTAETENGAALFHIAAPYGATLQQRGRPKRDRRRARAVADLSRTNCSVNPSRNGRTLSICPFPLLSLVGPMGLIHSEKKNFYFSYFKF